MIQNSVENKISRAFQQVCTSDLNLLSYVFYPMFHNNGYILL